MFGTLGMPELLVIGVVCLLIFGPRRLPQMGKALGEAIREFRNVGNEIERDEDKAQSRFTSP
jgi:sec-independent protein translocase protein TatA